jgi:hypothetical protein
MPRMLTQGLSLAYMSLATGTILLGSCERASQARHRYIGCDAIITEHTVPTGTPKNLDEVRTMLWNLEFALGRMADTAEFDEDYEHLGAITYTGCRIEMALENLDNYLDMMQHGQVQA